MAKKARRGPGRKGYGKAFKAKVLETARKENLTGQQVRDKFGISLLTFYRWRGPVRATRASAALPAAPKALKQSELRRIIREEVAAAIRRLLT